MIPLLRIRARAKLLAKVTIGLMTLTVLKLNVFHNPADYSSHRGSHVDGMVCSKKLLGQPKSIEAIEDCPECSQITCERLLFSTPRHHPIFNITREVMNLYSNKFNTLTIEQLLSLSRDCDNFKRLRGYHLDSSEEERQYPIAFTILAHQDEVQTERLLRTIYRPQNVYCLHVDSKSTAMVDNMSHLVKCFDNVFIASKLENVIYTGFSRLQAEINCLQDLLSSSVEWKYLLNTAATGFPLKTNLELVRTLKIFNGVNDIKAIPTANNTLLQSRFLEKHIEVNGNRKGTHEPYPPPPHNLTIVKGNAYSVFSRAFMEFVVSDPRARDFLEWCRYTKTPDEHFWHTLHSTYANPHIDAPGGFSGGYSEDSLSVHVVWTDSKERCFGQFVHYICILGIENLPGLVTPETQHYNFVNKLFKDFEPLVLECLENWIEYKVACIPKFDSDFYQNLPFVRISK